MKFILSRESSLNLTAQGTLGVFRVGKRQTEINSFEVKYLLTHVGLDFRNPSNDALLSTLAPVREIIDFASLDFDEIMQRDIDDARVSAELVPYLLDENSTDTIKLFPPIVVMVLPIEEGRNKPADFYPDTDVIVDKDEPGSRRGYDLLITRSGTVGREVFQFEQPIIDGTPICHDKVRLRLNTHRTRLVIVDGQHRAMALLAIYRNLKDQWTDERRAPFKEYYAEWTPDYIQNFNLGDINLPVILCTVPALDNRYQGDFDLKKAARSIFLTLNKTARKVSDSRNKLLDDNDLIAYMMRCCLSEVKQKDSRSPRAFRIWNVELDQFGDKLKIQSAIAITGVNHVYYIIEHCLLDSGDIRGVAPRSGKFYKRTKGRYISDCIDRLDGRNVVGSQAADSIRRDSFSQEVAKKLAEKFREFYGQYLLRAFECFAPYDRHNRAVLSLEGLIEKYQDRQLRPILFEGQGIGRVFENHRDNLHGKLKSDYFESSVPEIRESAKRLDATAERIREALAGFRRERTQLFFEEFTDKRAIRDEGSGINPRLIEWVNNLFDNLLSTVAFQSALVCGFFGEFEKAMIRVKRDSTSAVPLDRQQTFDEYLGQINEFFTPRTPSQLCKVIRVLSGEVKPDDWRITASNQTFRSVVYRGEMQPDQWPKYRYLLLELWRPSHPVLKEVVDSERDLCRREVFAALHEHYRTTFCRENRKLEDDLTSEEKRHIFDQAYAPYSEMLKNVGAAPLERSAMKKAASEISATALTDAEQETDFWPGNPDSSSGDDNAG